ncbi:YitT family protein [Clostridium algidicarnis]|uniref:YitT family protein n=1 Tax=Clostridium algidicarnis TaxID=37659 RepID=UPI001C0D6DAD|nr:YitT family protein [Clostridium algidicarnis]MBU3204683.1 YitT family protein [Clostridium algidicarnis]MBU3212832.1 YitT family protein [Clostridium algidicarnis]MBU3223476.1 YitT family protein [Clostridium algidicarnis]
MRERVKELIFISIGNLMVASGMYFFLMPNNLATGGVNGLGLIINYYLPKLPVGALMMMMNLILFVVGFLIIGKAFGAKTIYTSLELSGMIWIMEKLWPLSGSLVNDMIIELIFGILMTGIGMGIIFYQNASTGGTDIIAKIINKIFNINMGVALLISDFTITLMAGATFGLRIGMYALLGVIINSFVIDSVIEGFNICKEVVVISSSGDKVKKYIMDELERGITIYSANGGYTEETKEVITTVLDRREVIKLNKYIKGIDKDAFIIVRSVHEAIGEGFKIGI